MSNSMFAQQANYSRQRFPSQSSLTKDSFPDRSNISIIQEESEDNYKRKKSQSKVKGISTPASYEFTEVFVWGDDQSGQLGLYHQKMKKGNQEQTTFKLPKTCSFNIVIKQIACGENHSAILTNQGHLYMMGSNSDGQLGIGDNCNNFQSRNCAGAPCLVDSLKECKVKNVYCGKNFTFAIIQQSAYSSVNELEGDYESIYAWGCNNFGQLGIAEVSRADIPIKLRCFEQEEVSIANISCGSEHTLFMTTKGQVYACGSNRYGQLGIPSETQIATQPLMIQSLSQNVTVQASAGYQHSLFLTSDGEVYGSGSNQHFQLGVSEVLTFTEYPVLIQALQKYKITKVEAKSHSAAITQNGELFLWGKGIFGQYRLPQKILTISNQVVDVSLGSSLGAALDIKGLLWTWGKNQHGELGVGDTDPRVHPYPVLTLKGKSVQQLQCGGSFVIALGQNIKKEIPGLQFKKQKVTKKQKHEADSLTKNKKRNSSSSKLLRKHSITSLGKVYGESSDAYSPRENKNKLVKVLKKKHSKSQLKNKSNEIPKQKRIKKNINGALSGDDSHNQSKALNSSILFQQQKNASCNINQIVGNHSQDSPKQKKQKLHQDVISNHEATHDSLLSHKINQQSSQTQYSTNKEIMIKDLTLENKQLKYEQDLHRKEIKAMRQQLESLEKQLEKAKSLACSTQDLAYAQSQVKRKKAKIEKMKKENQELQQERQSLKEKVESQEKDKLDVSSQKEQVSQQLLQLQTEYQVLQQKLVESEQRASSQEQDIAAFSQELLQITEHSKDVERNLLAKLQELSEKYQSTFIQLEEVKGTQGAEKKKNEELYQTMKDQQIYIKAVERENAFLREEIEKVKYSKDKNEYNKFISGLVPIRGRKTLQDSQNEKPLKNPLQDSQISNYEKRDPTPQKQDQEEVNEMRMSYNQKLLKDIERKTMKENMRSYKQ